MKLDEAYKIATEYFIKLCNKAVNNDSILDAGSHWIFYPGYEGVTEFGIEGIKIEKKTGNIEVFILPNDENFELLDRATKITKEDL